MGFPGDSMVKKPLAKEETQEMWDSISVGTSLEEEMQASPVFLLGKLYGQRSQATVCGGAKKLDVTDHTCMHVAIHFG